MIRAILASLVLLTTALLWGLPLFLIGLVRPWRWGMARVGLWWSRLLLWVAGAKLQIVGRERIPRDRPCFFMANHQSALDIPIMIFLLDGDVRFFSKSDLFRIPVFGWVLARYGYIPVDKRRPRITYRALQRLLPRYRKNPLSIAVFPEGTRSRDGRLSTFRRGTMRVAASTGMSIVPVTIDGSYRVNHRDEYRLRPGLIRVVVHEPIPPDEVVRLTPDALRDRVVQAIAADLSPPQPHLSRGTEPLQARTA